MTKRSFFFFAAFFVAFAVAIPIWAVSKEGDPDSAPTSVSADQEYAKELFATNCGSCHTLALAGTDGVVGPNLDDLLGDAPDPTTNVPRVEAAIENGVQGRMPAGILQGTDAKIVAEFVSAVAGK
jgi:mono/diheme cytochrome c family protein